MAAALLDAGGADFAGFVDDDQDVYFAFQSAGNGVGGVELAGAVEFLEVFADGLRPCFHGLCCCFVGGFWVDSGFCLRGSFILRFSRFRQAQRRCCRWR